MDTHISSFGKMKKDSSGFIASLLWHPSNMQYLLASFLLFSIFWFVNLRVAATVSVILIMKYMYHNDKGGPFSTFF